jgi:4-amino-4-deoxy-L-arabinose transferase-like glycosyltransferase
MTRAPVVVLVVVLAAYLLPLSSPRPLMEDDEGLHAAIAQEMVERGDWIVPRLLGEPFLDKPILYFWLQAGSIAAFGASEFAVRLPGTLVALAGAAAIGWLTAAVTGRTAGAWAALIYATMALPYGVALAPLHDLVMVPLVTVAIGAYWHARHAATTGALVAWTFAAGVALGLSMLGKGLTGVGLAGVGVAAWLIWTRALSWRLVAVGAASVALAAAIAWPWYAALERAVPGYLQYFFADRHLGGLASDAQRHAGRPVWYYVPIVVAGTWPWGLLLWRRARPTDDAERLLWAWLVADFVVLSLAGSKLATYILPALPAVASLAALRLARHEAADGALGAAAIVSAGLALAAPPATAWWMGIGAPPLQAWLWALVPVAVLVWSRSRTTSAAERLLLVTAAALTAVALGTLPMLAARLTAEPLAARVNAEGRMPERLVVVDEGIGSFVFYLRPDLRRGLDASRVARVSRFSLADVEPRAGTVVAIAADRVPGVLELYDMRPGLEVTEGDFVVRPLEAFRPKAPSARPEGGPKQR